MFRQLSMSAGVMAATALLAVESGGASWIKVGLMGVGRITSRTADGEQNIKSPPFWGLTKKRSGLAP